MKSKIISLLVLGSILVGGGQAYIARTNSSNPSKEIVQSKEEEPNKETKTETESDSTETVGNNTETVGNNTETDSDNTVTNSNKQETESNSIVTNSNRTQADSNFTEKPSNNVVSNNNNNNTATNNNNNSAVQNQGSTTVVSDKFMAEVEQAIFKKVNEERSKNGVSALSYNSTMEKYARIKSQDMGDNNYFSHTDLSGNYITAKMKADGVSYNAWAENIAYIEGVSDPTALAQQFMTNWMNSEGHRQNILSTNYSSIGVGVYKIGNKVYATQEFYR